MHWTEETLLYRHGSLSTDEAVLVVNPHDVGLHYVGLTVFSLPKRASRSIKTVGDEAMVLPLSGAWTVQVGSKSFDLNGRANVFSGVSDFVYLPLGVEAEISTPSGGEVALPRTPCETSREVVCVRARDVDVEIRGASAATRQVNNLLLPEETYAEKLIVVEVITPEGNVSSYPPHKHDELNASTGEMPVEEIYYFRFDRDGGYGLFRQYAADGEFDVTTVLRDGDIFLVPKGFHGPSVAVPGHTMYFLNVLGGESEIRSMTYSDDPAQHWIRDSWSSQTPDPRLSSPDRQHA
jgi:5-deoxy-glucuronate isomerase